MFRAESRRAIWVRLLANEGVMRVRVTAVDERDSKWDTLDNRYRVYFFTGDPAVGGGFATSVHDIEDAELLEVLSWARSEAGDHRMFAIALVSPPRDSGDRGIGMRWLVGMDANDPRDEHPRAEEIYKRMVERRASDG